MAKHIKLPFGPGVPSEFRELAETVNAFRTVDAGNLGESDGANQNLRINPTEIVRTGLFKIVESWLALDSSSSSGQSLPGGWYYCRAVPVRYYSAKDGWVEYDVEGGISSVTNRVFIWNSTGKSAPSSAVGDCIWAFLSPDSGFWELLTSIGGTTPERFILRSDLPKGGRAVAEIVTYITCGLCSSSSSSSGSSSSGSSSGSSSSGESTPMKMIGPMTIRVYCYVYDWANEYYGSQDIGDGWCICLGDTPSEKELWCEEGPPLGFELPLGAVWDPRPREIMRLTCPSHVSGPFQDPTEDDCGNDLTGGGGI